MFCFPQSESSYQTIFLHRSRSTLVPMRTCHRLVVWACETSVEGRRAVKLMPVCVSDVRFHVSDDDGIRAKTNRVFVAKCFTKTTPQEPDIPRVTNRIPTVATHDEFRSDSSQVSGLHVNGLFPLSDFCPFSVFVFVVLTVAFLSITVQLLWFRMKLMSFSQADSNRPVLLSV